MGRVGAGVDFCLAGDGFALAPTESGVGVGLAAGEGADFFARFGITAPVYHKNVHAARRPVPGTGRKLSLCQTTYPL